MIPSPAATRLPARLLAVGGSDSGGGAGIQADIKTATVLGAYAMTAVTAVTVQDTHGVHSVHPIPSAIVAAQISRVLGDVGADAVKTGMLVSVAIVEAVAEALMPWHALPLVIDTVMFAKGGAALLDDDGIAVMKRLLFPKAALITPNAPEAARLTGHSVETPEDQARAALTLRDAGARAVLVKGGHVAGDMVTDVLIDHEGMHMFRTRRIEASATHGTGCTLAAAIAVGLAEGLSLQAAVARGRGFVLEAIRTGLAFGQGTGPVNALHAYRKPQENV